MPFRTKELKKQYDHNRYMKTPDKIRKERQKAASRLWRSTHKSKRQLEDEELDRKAREWKYFGQTN